MNETIQNLHCDKEIDVSDSYTVWDCDARD